MSFFWIYVNAYHEANQAMLKDQELDRALFNTRVGKVVDYLEDQVI